MAAIFTTGHGNATTAELIDRLKLAGVVLVVDVRTKPYSRHHPQHSKLQLREALHEEGIEYLWRGSNLGGLGENRFFTETVQEVARLAESRRVALLCSETDWHHCHRHTMLEPAFLAEGLDVIHLERDGSPVIISATPRLF